MKQILSWKKFPLLVLASGILVSVTVAQSNSGNQKHRSNDTIPAKQKKIVDLDEALAELDRGEIEMQKALKEIDHQRLEADIREAMKDLDIDMAKMEKDLGKAIKEIDMQKINLDVQKAMKEIDDEKIHKEVAASLAKIDTEKIKIEMEKAKAEMEKVKAIDFKKLREDMARIQPEIEKAMQQAKVDIEKARKEITDYKNLVAALENDGLLKKGENYTIDYRNKELTVNGQKLSAEATRKYSEYLGDKKDFTLQKNGSGLEIDK